MQLTRLYENIGLSFRVDALLENEQKQKQTNQINEKCAMEIAMLMTCQNRANGWQWLVKTLTDWPQLLTPELARWIPFALKDKINKEKFSGTMLRVHFVPDHWYSEGKQRLLNAKYKECSKKKKRKEKENLN